jgi:hypothetical protein
MNCGFDENKVSNGINSVLPSREKVSCRRGELFRLGIVHSCAHKKYSPIFCPY